MTDPRTTTELEVPDEQTLAQAEHELRALPAGSQRKLGGGVYMRLDAAGRRRFTYRGVAGMPGGTASSWQAARDARRSLEERAAQLGPDADPDQLSRLQLRQCGSSQYFFDHGNCHNMTAQRASGGVLSTRFHIRLHPIHSDATLGWTTIGDAHHEDLTYCGHAVDANGSNGSGFDQGRRQLRILLENGGHGWYSEFWGNTQNFQQCDGDYASSDGYTVFSRAHQVNH